MKKRPFHDWEKKYGLINGRSIDGFQYWNYMRRDIFKSFDDEYAGVEPLFYRQMEKTANLSFLEKLKKGLRLFAPSYMKELKKCDVMFVCHSRRVDIHGKLVSIYTDYVADMFPGSVTLQRGGPGNEKRDRFYTKDLIFNEKLNVEASIYKYLIKIFSPKKYRRIYETIYREMEEPFREIREDYGLHPDFRLFVDRTVSLYFFYRYKKPRYKKMLKKISPKVIVEVIAQSFDAFIITEAAKELDIETVKLQHGAGTLELWYPENTCFPQFPDWYLTFGEFWKKGTHVPIPYDHIIPVGFTYHDIEMRDYPVEKRKQDKDTIIFLSGSKYGSDFFRLASELKRLRPALHVIYKLHPREYPVYKEKYEGLNDCGIEIIDNNDIPLYELFSRCSMQAGVESTAIYEGMSFALHTYIWDIPKAVMTEDLIETGYTPLFKDAASLAALIDGRKDLLADYDIGEIWKENSMENTVNSIKAILGHKHP